MTGIEKAIYEIAKALRVPVLVLALVAVALVLIELGAFLVELVRRRRRNFIDLESASSEARAALDRGDETGAKSALRPVAWSTQMARTLAFLVDQWGKPQFADRMAKGLADFDFRSVRRLDRTRLLVRAGPALGLMGTLIPLSPALSGLAKGNVTELQDNLQIAFSVTVLGLLVGAVAFGISLVRDRIYGQDLSDLEFVMATLLPEGDVAVAAAARPASSATEHPSGGTASASAPAPGSRASAAELGRRRRRQTAAADGRQAARRRVAASRRGGGFRRRSRGLRRRRPGRRGARDLSRARSGRRRRARIARRSGAGPVCAGRSRVRRAPPLSLMRRPRRRYRPPRCPAPAAPPVPAPTPDPAAPGPDRDATRQQAMPPAPASDPAAPQGDPVAPSAAFGSRRGH